MNRVTLPWRRKPPVLATRVTRYCRVTRASNTCRSSVSRTMAIMSFMLANSELFEALDVDHENHRAAHLGLDDRRVEQRRRAFELRRQVSALAAAAIPD